VQNCKQAKQCLKDFLQHEDRHNSLSAFQREDDEPEGFIENAKKTARTKYFSF